MPSTAGDVALHVAATLGWECISLQPGDKRPRHTEWQKRATKHAPTLKRWFSIGSHANLGLKTGAGSGVWAFDVDAHHGGLESLAKLTAEHGPLPETLTQATPNGGRHYIFRWPAEGGIGNRARIGDGGLDVRGENGFIVIAPSVLVDKATGEVLGEWVWLNWGTPIADAPEWLVALVRKHHTQTPERAPQPQRPPDLGKGRGEAWADAALDAICREIATAPVGQQEVTLNGQSLRIGQIVAGGYLPGPYALQRLVEAGMSMANGEAGDPWTLRVVTAKVERALRDGTAKGAVHPPPREPPPLQSIEGGSKRPRGAKQPEGAPQPALKVAASNKDWMKEHAFRYGEKGLDPRFPRNLRLMVEHWPAMAGRYTYDAWADALMINQPWPEDPRTNYPRLLDDTDCFALMAHLWDQGVRPSKESTIDALTDVARRAWAVNPVTSYLGALQWDGDDRLDRWLTTYMGVPVSPEASLFGRKFLIGAAARATRPRCKNDTMLIVEGPEGVHKSTALRALFGEDYFSDNLGDITNKDALIGLGGMWGIEWGEMAGQDRIPEADVKAFLSRQEDRFRPPYGRNYVMRPRRCVVVGTTNKRTYLRDTSGNRRYWPVTNAGKIDIDGIARDRDQLWAEAMHRLEAGETWWLEGPAEESLAKAAQETRFEVDEWEGVIITQMRFAYGFVATHDILYDWIGRDRGAGSKGAGRRLRAVMDRLQVPERRDRINGRQMRGYMFGPAPAEETP